MIVLGSLGIFLFMLLELDRPLPMTLTAVSTFTLLAALGVWFFVWLDRWEPEPSYLLIGAFVWGAGIAGSISALVNRIVYQLTESLEAAAMYSAPFIEETTKGLFIVVALLMTKRGRAELTSLTDAIIYGGMTGLGFAWIEHISYALQAETMRESLFINLIRLVLTSYLHTILTIIVAIGIWYGFVSRGGR